MKPKHRAMGFCGNPSFTDAIGFPTKTLLREKRLGKERVLQGYKCYIVVLDKTII